MASNSRTWPFTGATAWVAITDEQRTIAGFAEFPGYYGFQLKEKPNPDTPPVIIEAETGGRTFDIVNNAPNVGQVRISYETGICQFNIVDANIPCLCTYEGGGSPANIELLQEISTFFGRTTDDLDEGAVNKYFSGKDTDDLPEGAANFYLTGEGLGDVINAATAQGAPNDSGKIGFWDFTASALRQMTFTQLKAFLKTYYDTVYQAIGSFDINGLTEDTTPDYTSDYLPIYSDSASANRKTLIDDLLKSHPGVAKAWVNFDGTSAANVNGTYSRTGTTVTVTYNDHGYLVGHVIYASITSGSGTSGLYTITGVTTNTFTYTEGGSGATSGNITLLRRTIRGSFSVHSVTYKNSTGLYIVNMSTIMANANYSVTASESVSDAIGAVEQTLNPRKLTQQCFEVVANYNNGSYNNAANAFCQVFGQ